MIVLTILDDLKDRRKDLRKMLFKLAGTPFTDEGQKKVIMDSLLAECQALTKEIEKLEV